MAAPKKRIKSSILLFISFLFLFICMANIQFPFVRNSGIWNVIIKILIFIQFLIIQIIVLYEFFKTTVKQWRLYLVVISAFCIVNLFFNFNIFTLKATLFWDTERNDGNYLGILVKSFFILIIAGLMGLKARINRPSIVTVMAFFMLLTFLPMISIMLLDNKYIEIMLILLLVIVYDTTGYFGGKIYGKKRPFMYISPTKTVAGYVIGITTATFIFIVTYGITAYISNYSLTCLIRNKESLYSLFVITIFLSFSAAGGDLLFSKIKRDYGVKDFSRLIPGHGGFLDRADGMITTLFIFGLLSPFL